MRGGCWLLAFALAACTGSSDTGGLDGSDDADGDGFTADVDCDDNDFYTHPGAPERCNGKDNDCNGIIDDDPRDVPVTYVDADGDGYGDPASALRVCEQGQRVLVGDDCDDTNAAINPLTQWFIDNDDDGYGVPLATLQQCEKPQGYGLTADDCDDDDPTIYPGAPEVCDGADNSCNGLVDDADPAVIGGNTFYQDLDNDGFGNPNQSVQACAVPPGYVNNALDCDDTNASVNPNAAEDCGTPYDDNCDGSTSAINAVNCTTFYIDADGDLFGGTENVCQCEPVGLFTANTPDDCDDNDATLNPATVWYFDGDGDGFGATSPIATGCEQPPGYVRTATDCDDTNPTVGAPFAHWVDGDGDGYGDASAEPVSLCPADAAGFVSNNDDCDDTNDAISPETLWYRDADNDGYGDANDSRASCEQPAGFASNDEDCNDASSAINPGAIEVCDGIDNNCSNLVDDADPTVDTSTGTAFYADLDGDGFGAGAPTFRCASPSPDYTTDNTDCNDDDPSAYPGAIERCNGFDDDCQNNGEINAVSIGLVGYPDLQAAIDAADYTTWGQSIAVCPGEYVGPYYFSGDFGGISINGSHGTVDEIVFTGRGLTTIFDIERVAVNASNVTVRDGAGRLDPEEGRIVGGAAYVIGSPSNYGEFYCQQCEIYNNEADLGGVVYSRNGYFGLTMSNVYNNTADDGGVFYGGSNAFPNFSASNLHDNHAQFNGGVVNAQGVDLYLVTMSSNSAGQSGGSIYRAGVNGSVYMEQSTITQSTASQGGAIAAEGGDMYLYDCTIADNTANLAGGISLNEFSGLRTLLLGNTLVEGNSADDCGGIWVEGAQVEITTGWTPGIGGVRGNTALSYGGGICADSRSSIYSTDVTSPVITDNTGGFGGGVYLYQGSDSTISQVTELGIANNTASEGGGLYIDSGVRLQTNRLRITDNNASRGGGLFAMNNVTVFSSGEPLLLASNGASEDGGGLFALPSAFEAVEAVSNEATRGGGVFLQGDGNSSFEFGELISSSNIATDGGGLVALDTNSINGSQPITLVDNSASRNGGGAYFSDIIYGAPLIRAYSNFAGQDGGGLYFANGGEVYVEVLNNTADGDGGGVAVYGDWWYDFAGSQYFDNQANRGGGIYLNNSGVEMNGSSFAYNHANLGGAAYIRVAFYAIVGLNVEDNTSSDYVDLIWDPLPNTWLDGFLSGFNNFYGQPAARHINGPPRVQSFFYCDFSGCY